MTHHVAFKCKLSNDILAALLLAQQANESEVAERLLQALEVLADGHPADEDLSTAYLKLARSRGMEDCNEHR